MKTTTKLTLRGILLSAFSLQPLALAQCPTSVSGTVYAPNGTDPIYNAVIYVPSGAVQPFPPGVHCSQCGREVSGQPLVWTVSGSDGRFTLTNMPAGVNIPLVIQIGRWRRVLTIPTVTACATTALTASQTRLPRIQGEFSALDNIPLMAVATGQADGLECLLRKIGIDDSQFSNPGGAGRVQFYQGEGLPGAIISPTTPSATQLWGSQAQINQYDIVLFPDQGAEFLKTPAQQQVVINYVNSGGRVLASHFSYVWLFNDAPFSSTALWNAGQPAPTDQAGYIATNFPRGLAMAQWLQTIGATTTFGQLPLSSLNQDFNGVVPPSLLWISLGAPPSGAFTAPMHYTFDAPVGAPPANQCGRVLYNDYIVEPAANNTGLIFPSECPGGPMSPEEQLLEFALFDLSSDINSCIPVLSLVCAPNKTVQGGTAWSFDPPTASNPCTANPVVSVLGTATNGTCPQVITRTWVATDSCGNSAMCSQVVTANCLVVTMDCPPFPVPPGGTLAFTGTVTNTCLVTLTNVMVLESQPAPAMVLFGPATLTPGAGSTFAGAYSVAACSCGPFVTTLTGSGAGVDGLTYSNSITLTCPGTNYAVPGDLNGDGIVDQNELNQVLANYWTHSAWLYMTNPASLGNGLFQFALTNATGWNFTVLVSSNMVDWTNLPNPAYPVYQFVDPAAASNAPNRFYRLRYP